uniref:Pentatricopeptide repeat-containing protein n=1 Tax=Nelumbo nucifera TaxID=4432 RepID=A0A822Y6U3_NELNU|nr:TPA_asm: hypothetical protein HUJ06_029698 [Nelumbo nucifera]
MIKSSQISDTYSPSRLAELYAISDHGSLKYVEKVLNSVEEPYPFIWNVVIRENLMKQNPLKAILLYNQMLIVPDIAHYGCMVDLFGHAGLFNRIEETIRIMPMKPDAVMWKTLLGACRIHKNLEMGEQSGLKLIELAPDEHASYVLLSSIYAMADKWDKVHEMRKLMWKRGIIMPPGSSSIELDGVVYEFFVGDTTHSRKKEIYKMLGEMGERFKNVCWILTRKR